MTNPTPSIWQSWSKTTRYSVLAFVGTIVLTFLSLGALGYLIYYPVMPILPASINDLPGDSVWPAVIMAGLCWAPGFLMAAATNHFASRQSQWIRVILYVGILWIWDYLVWAGILVMSAAE